MHLRDIPVTVETDSFAGCVGIVRECPYKSPYTKPDRRKYCNPVATLITLQSDCLLPKPHWTTTLSPGSLATGRSELSVQSPEVLSGEFHG